MSEAVRTILQDDSGGAKELAREDGWSSLRIFGIRGAEFSDSQQEAGTVCVEVPLVWGDLRRGGRLLCGILSAQGIPFRMGT